MGSSVLFFLLDSPPHDQGSRRSFKSSPPFNSLGRLPLPSPLQTRFELEANGFPKITGSTSKARCLPPSPKRFSAGDSPPATVRLECYPYEVSFFPHRTLAHRIYPPGRRRIKAFFPPPFSPSARRTPYLVAGFFPNGSRFFSRSSAYFFFPSHFPFGSKVLSSPLAGSLLLGISL